MTYETPLMTHWRTVNVILVAAGEREATFGEIRHVRDDHPMVAAHQIWDDRRETSIMSDPLWTAA